MIKLLVLTNTLLMERLDKWLKYFDDDAKQLTINRKGKIIQLTLPEVNRYFYNTYSVSKVKDPNHLQKRSFEAWKK